MAEGPNYQEYLDAADLERAIPGTAGNYRRTSDPTINYNCLAHAVGVSWGWFDPEPGCAGYYWPVGVKREWSLPAIRKVLEDFGFKEECDDSCLEDGYEKVAIYIDKDDTPAHFARQLENGRWTSKCGELIDIEHETLECIECDEYGTATHYVKRKRRVSAVAE